ncbi:MAG: OmpH family outer membrane protein [Flavobacteriales bacterium]|nr:OmpH family outer membrane protein [Flavobacteriales bacterium]
MQKFNTILSVILLLVVGYLLVDRFKTQEVPVEEKIEEEPSTDDNEIGLSGEGKIAYIDIDSINAKYVFLEDKLKVLRDEQSRSERRMTNKLKKAEDEFIKLQEEARYMTPSQMQEAEQKIQASQQELESYEKRLANDLYELESSIQNDLNDRIMRAVNSTNAKYGFDYVLAKSSGGGILIGKESYNLTNEVLETLNSDYTAELAAEKTGSSDK